MTGPPTLTIARVIKIPKAALFRPWENWKCREREADKVSLPSLRYLPPRAGDVKHNTAKLWRPCYLET